MIESIVVSWSELDTYRQCPYKWHLAYSERYTKPVDDNSPLGKGGLWHEVIETHYQMLMNASDKLSDGLLLARCRKAVDDLLESKAKQGHDLDMIKLMWWIYDGYVDVYGTDADHTILGVETTHLAPLGEIEERDGRVTPVTLKFKIDRTVRDKFGHVRVIDEKSHATLPTDHDYDFLDQFGLYVWGLRQLGISVRGAIHSASKTKPNQGDLIKPGDPGYKPTMKSTPLDARFKRTPIHYTDAQLNEIAADALADVQQMYSGANHRRRHADSDRCRWRCNFTEACLFGRRTGKPGATVKMLELQGFTQERERH